MPKLDLVGAINMALAQEMERDERVIVLGEDVGLNGGVFRVTDGLQKRFGCERVVDAPAHDDSVWGYHLLLDLAGCRLTTVRSAPELRAFVTELVDAIDMVAYGEPLLAHFADHVPDAAGWSLVQLIETSSITGHFCDASGDAYLDVFSCKAFAPETAIAVVERRLQPRRVSARFLPRAA